jgi:hypothetical protein
VLFCEASPCLENPSSRGANGRVGCGLKRRPAGRLRSRVIS